MRGSMSWRRQVLHVAVKDVVRVRLALLGYFILVALATAVSLQLRMIGFGTMGWSLLLLFTGMVVMALLVQEDSPARSDAFWVTLPLSPSAVFAAKLLTAAVVLGGGGLLGQLVVLRGLDADVGRYPLLVAETLLTYGVVLGGAGVIAALTRNLASFLAVGVVLLAGIQVVGTTVEMLSAGDVETSSTSLVPTVVYLVAVLALLGHQYHTRRVARGAVLLGTLVLASLVGPRFLPADDGPGATRSADTRATAANGISLTLDSASLQPERRQLQLRLQPESAHAGVRHRLVDTRVYLVDEAGQEHRLPAMSHGLLEPALDALWSVRHDGDAPAHERTHSYVLHVDRTETQAELLRSGAAHLVVRGYVEVQERTPLLTVPLRAGSVRSAQGVRLRVQQREEARGYGYDDDPSAVHVVMLRLTPAGGDWRRRSGAEGDVDFTVVNVARGEATPLQAAGGGSASLGLVLPGPDVRIEHVRLRPPPATELAPREVPPEWFAGADLHVALWKPVRVQRLGVRVSSTAVNEISRMQRTRTSP